MDYCVRSTSARLEIIEGQEVLTEGGHLAEKTWNMLQFAYVGFPRAIYRQSGQKASALHPAFKYPGYFVLDKILHKSEPGLSLNARCCMYILKEFDAAMQSWFSSVKSDPQARPPGYTLGPRQLTFEINRNARPIEAWTYRLTVLGRQFDHRYATIKLQPQPGIPMDQVTLIRLQPNGAGATLCYRVQPEGRAGQQIAAIDLGIINSAVVAFQNGESILYSGRAILSSDQWYHKRVALCKPKHWHKGVAESRPSERSRSYRIKAGHIRRLAIHNLTRNIVKECLARGVGLIVLGDLRGIRRQANHGKVGNQKLHAWAYNQILQQIRYKAAGLGIEVTTVSERGTSKHCHYCGQIGQRRPRGLLTCARCGIQINADVNGAFNILNKVSPVPVYAGLGVEAVLPGLPSPEVPAGENPQPGSQGTGQVPVSLRQIGPTIVRRFNLPGWSLGQGQPSV